MKLDVMTDFNSKKSRTSCVRGNIGGFFTSLLEPTNGLIEGDAGDTVGWGFLLTNTQNYLVVTGAEFQSSTSPDIFTDFISAPDNFFVVGPGFGASTVWGQTFDAQPNRRR
ncbi:hypothetical protein [Methylomonas sp. TEB]|uniref:hypothetical protein n=1 Tax=Methylomonas sp. TEB TaxID=3398229 RepID=UPI0039F60897